MTINDLLGEGTLVAASLPPDNGRELGARPLTLPLIAEDYPAKTAIMWNAAYGNFLMPDCNRMLIANPANAARILHVFRDDSRYVGGGAGVGFKEAVIPHLDELTPLARAMGAVNIIKKMRNGTLAGDNTNGVGYARSLEALLATLGKSLRGAQVLILGAGGSGRAIAFALAESGARLTILNRTESKAKELAHAVNAYVGSQAAMGAGRLFIPAALPTQDAVVSVVDDATSPLDDYSPLGDMDLPVTYDSIVKNRIQTEQLLATAKPDLIVSDIRIRGTITPMLEKARTFNMQTLDGIPMVINQGALAFWWLYGNTLKRHGVRLPDVVRIMLKATRSGNTKLFAGRAARPAISLSGLN